MGANRLHSMPDSMLATFSVNALRPSVMDRFTFV